MQGIDRAALRVLAAISAADVIDSLINGHSCLDTLGLEYQVATVVHPVCCVIALCTANERFHRVFVAVNLLYQMSWMFRMYEY